MEPDSLINVRQDASLLESVSKPKGKIIERGGMIMMARGASPQFPSTSFYIVCHAITPQSSCRRTIKNTGGMKPKSTTGRRRYCDVDQYQIQVDSLMLTHIEIQALKWLKLGDERTM